ncbi:MAG TPA: hypothetical protein VID48_12060, partial [Solirubrobacteraceae bacterium]
MRIIPFPNQRERDLQRAWLSDLETALHGDGPNGQKWSQLREDVRALAAPMTVEFERQLSERIVEREERSAPKQPHRRLGRLRPTVPAFAAMSVACMVIAAVLIAAPWREAGHTAGSSAKSSSASARADHLGPAFGQAESVPPAGAIHAAKSAVAQPSASASAGAAANAPVVVNGAAA